MNGQKWFIAASIVIALAFAGAVALPHILQRLDRRYPFRGIEIMASDAEAHYAARVHEVYEGRWQAGNVFYSSPKDQPPLQPAYPEMAIASMAKLLGIDPVSALLMSTILCAFILPLILVGFFAALTGKRWESLLAVTVLLFMGALIGAPWDLAQHLFGTAPSYALLLFSRPINPLWTACWFFSALWLLTAWIERRSRFAIGIAAVCTTVCLYSYFYAWSYLLAVTSLLSVWFAWKGEKRRLADLGFFLAIFLILSLPYFLQLRETIHHPFYLESARRLGMVDSRAPVFGVWLTVLIVIGFLSQKLWPRTWPIPLALAIGGLIAINQQVITGHFIVPHHYHWYFIQPLASVLSLIIIFGSVDRFLLRTPVGRSVLLVCSFLVAILFGFVGQVRAYDGVRPVWGRLQELRPVLDALHANVQPPKTVYSTDPWVLDLVPVYTSLDVYSAANANNYLVPMTRTRDVFFFDLWLSGLKPEDAAKRFYTDLRWSLGSKIYAIYYREAFGDYRYVPDNIVAEHVQAYAQYYRFPFQKKLSLHPLDLLVSTSLDPQTKEFAQFKAQGRKIWEQYGYSIFSFHSLFSV